MSQETLKNPKKSIKITKILENIPKIPEKFKKSLKISQVTLINPKILEKSHEIHKNPTKRILTDIFEELYIHFFFKE